ncbi:IS110 family transposase [Anoxybacteroides amylolyticum]|uniref:IS110 family transposase n=1 Tax=Anoxybacteroides amylolyticum TaxID=294699 RepID=UPI00082CFB3D|nr:transposase [Anoxybacillus amylolyticus]
MEKERDGCIERCCGIDVQQKPITACTITPKGKAIRTFRPMTDELLEFVNRLKEIGVTHVATESANVYWKPLYNLL